MLILYFHIYHVDMSDPDQFDFGMKKALEQCAYVIDGDADALRAGVRQYTSDELKAYMQRIKAEQSAHCLGDAKITICEKNPKIMIGFDHKGDLLNFALFMQTPDVSPVPYGKLPLHLYLLREEKTSWRQKRVTPEVSRPLSGKLRRLGKPKI